MNYYENKENDEKFDGSNEKLFQDKSE